MGNPAQVGSGIGALGFLKLGIENSWGATYTYLGGASPTIAIGATSVTVINTGNIAVGMYCYFDDGLITGVGTGSNAEYPNLNEPPIKVTVVAGTTITLNTATLAAHYGPTVSTLQTSGSRVHFAYKPTKGVYYESESLTAALGYWSSNLISGSRIGRQQILKGAEKVSGNIVAPLGPGWNNDFFVGICGYEQETFGTTPTGTAALTANTAVGATTFTTAGTFTVGQYVQIDVTPNREVRQVTAFATSTATLDTPLRFAHLSGVAAKVVVAPFTHAVVFANVLPSFSFEKFAAGDYTFGGGGNVQMPVSFGYTGIYANKAQLKVDNKTGPKLTVTMDGQGEVLIPSTTVPAYPTTDNFAFYDTYLSIDGVQVTNFADIEISIDNKLAMDTFLNNNTKLGIIKPGLRMLDGKLTLYFSSFAQYADYKGNVDRHLTVQFYQPASGYSTTIDFTKIRFTKYVVKQPAGGLVTVDVDLEIKLDTSTGTEGTVTLVDGNWGNYGF